MNFWRETDITARRPRGFRCHPDVGCLSDYKMRPYFVNFRTLSLSLGLLTLCYVVALSQHGRDCSVLNLVLYCCVTVCELMLYCVLCLLLLQTASTGDGWTCWRRATRKDWRHCMTLCWQIGRKSPGQLTQSTLAIACSSRFAVYQA